MSALRKLDKVLRLIRDGWLMVGIALLMIVGLEAAYRGQGWVRRLIRSPDVVEAGPASLRGRAAWREHDHLGATRDSVLRRPLYDPYRGWWIRSFESPDLMIDSLGRRRVLDSPAQAGVRIFAFGGSTMWGHFAPDSATIPTLVANDLSQRFDTPISVENYAQSGFNLTQELITLVLELRRGNVPDIAIFLDGINEIGPTMEGGWPGEIYQQAAAARRHERGTPPINSWEAPRGVGASLIHAGNELQFMKRLRRALGMQASVPRGTPASLLGRDPASVCPVIASYYKQLTRTVEGIADAYGFTPVFLWQPALGTTHKRLGPNETKVAASPTEPTFNETVRVCSQLTDSLMSGRAGTTYFALHDLFDRDTVDVFLDHYGHVTEEGDAKIAHRIADILEGLVAGGGRP